MRAYSGPSGTFISSSRTRKQAADLARWVTYVEMERRTSSISVGHEMEDTPVAVMEQAVQVAVREGLRGPHAAEEWRGPHRPCVGPRGACAGSVPPGQAHCCRLELLGVRSAVSARK